MDENNLECRNGRRADHLNHRHPGGGRDRCDSVCNLQAAPASAGVTMWCQTSVGYQQQ